MQKEIHQNRKKKMFALIFMIFLHTFQNIAKFLGQKNGYFWRVGSACRSLGQSHETIFRKHCNRVLKVLNLYLTGTIVRTSSLGYCLVITMW